MISELVEFSRTGEYFETDFELGKLIRFIYGLSILEYQLFEEILILNNPTSQYLKERLKRKNIGLINKALRHLSDLGLIDRKKVSIEDRTGFHYTYSTRPLGEIKQLIKGRVDNWYNKTIAKIDNLESYYQNKFELVPLEE